jgi:hypothetical protein
VKLTRKLPLSTLEILIALQPTSRSEQHPTLSTVSSPYSHFFSFLYFRLMGIHRRDGWQSSNCGSIQSLKSFSEDEQSSGGDTHSFQSHTSSFNGKNSHVKMTIKAECIINKSKTLSVNDYTFLKTIGKVSLPHCLSVNACH